MDEDPIRNAGSHRAPGTPRSPEEFLDWVADLHPDGTATTLADVVHRARSLRGGNDGDWRPPFLTDTNAGSGGSASAVDTDEPHADDPDGAGARLFAPTEINAVYTGPGAAGPSGAGYPATPPSRPTPGYGPPPGFPPPYPQPGYGPQPGYPPPQAPPPPAYGRPPGYPPGYRRAPYPPPAYGPYAAAPQPGYGPPAPPQQVPSPYFDPTGAPGAGVLPAWDALPAQQRSEHFVALPGWAQSLFWAQLNPVQRQDLAAVLPPRPGV